jgi:hypothetical protein
MNRNLVTTLLVLLAATLSLVAFDGCGGSDSLTRIEGTSASTSPATLNHWMRAMAGGDFRTSIGTKGPRGLVSEPANYSECAAAAKKIVPRSYTGRLKLTDGQIEQKCRALYQAIKAQALSFLISVQWTVAEGAEEGLKVSDALLQKEFARYRKQPYPTEADLQKYLAERQWVLSDVLYQLKRNVLVTQILPHFQAKVKKAGGGEATYVRLALQRYHKLIAKTTCKQGYVVPNCKEYHEPSTAPPSPNSILEAFVKGERS